MTQALYAPWRMDYIRQIDKSGGCFLCQAAASKTPEDHAQCLVLWQSEHCVVVMNRYPYANGHLLVAPRAHKADLEDLTQSERLDLQNQTVEAISLLKRAVSAQGFNIGINLGRIAGAGVPGHIHQHVVPRWGGDINFISVVGEVKIIPQAISVLYAELMRTRAEMSAQTPPEMPKCG